MLYITVHLYGKNGVPGEFREYEKKALDIFKKHGGEVVVAYVPERALGGAEIPDEIQVLRMESKVAFEKFMNDSERLKMVDERNVVIRKTEVYLSNELVEY